MNLAAHAPRVSQKQDQKRSPQAAAKKTSTSLDESAESPAKKRAVEKVQEVHKEQEEQEEQEEEVPVGLEAICKLCGSGDNEDEMLLCDACDVGMHKYCLDPPMTEIPGDSPQLTITLLLSVPSRLPVPFPSLALELSTFKRGTDLRQHRCRGRLVLSLLCACSSGVDTVWGRGYVHS
eukprot:1615898-Rhodomonas_salina.2